MLSNFIKDWRNCQMKKRIFYTVPAFLLVFGFLLGGCFLFEDTEDTDETDNGVKSVTVSPATASVAHGGTETFTAKVEGENDPDQTVTWTVEGGAKTGTAINKEGVLTVASDETATKLTVKATSTVDTKKSGTAAVTVTAAKATVTGVTVSPATATVRKGLHQTFTAAVTGANNPAKTVTWSIVETGKHSGTTINSSGLLTVSASETLTTLNVKAASTVDTGKSGTAKVTVSQLAAPPTITDNRVLDPDTTSTQLSGNSLTVSGTNHGGGNKWLIQPTTQSPSRAYGYETWDESGSPGTASFTWYGKDKGGGLAFSATWTNVKDFLARTGYNWNENKSHADYGNIYCGFNFTRSNRYNGNFSYIGIYGWSRNPGASVASERLIEYYIVEDSYGNQYRDPAGYQLNIGNETLGVSEVTPSYTLDGGTYKVFKVTRTGPSIAGNTTVTVGQIVIPNDARILNPSTTNTQLTGNGLTVSGSNHGGGNKWLIQPTTQSPSRAYGYETWDEAGSPGSASFTWYGKDKGGGLAFSATWTNVKDFLARTGYNWNENKSHSEYGNIYCGFNFTRSDRYNGNFSYIGIYGWSRNPGASTASERLIEYYIVEDSYGNQYRDAAGFMLNIGNETLGVSEVTPSYTLDDGTYKVFKVTRTGPSIDNNTTFTQFFSVRQTPRQNGTISITEHFKKWEERGMNLGTNIYECKFKVEAGGNEAASPGTGTFDARLIQFYRANDNGTIIEITQ
jgi:endo-1,4-beta-xylanase